MLFRANIPAELDVLDSPILELGPTPIGSAALGRVPGSALAERIFNDPSAWETSRELEHDDSEDEDGEGFKLHVEGLDKPEVETARVERAPPRDSKARLITSPSPFGLHGRRESHPMAIRKHNIRPISLASLFEQGSADSFVKDIQSHLRDFNQEGGIERTPATADIFSPMSDSSLGSANTDMSIYSPSPIYSASTTLSFLDLYLDSPKMNMRKSLYAKRQSQAKTSPHAPALVIPTEPMPFQPLLLFSPMSLHPDMTVEPLKRGSSVPPLDQISTNIPARTPTATVSKQQPEQQAKLPPPPLTSVLSPEPKLSLPPGLVQPAKPAASEVQQPKHATNKENMNTPPRSLPKPQHQTRQPEPQPSALPPPYSRTPLTPQRRPSASSVSAVSSASPSPASSRVSTPSSVRKLPTIPLKSAAPCHSAMTTHSPAFLTASSHAPSPLPSSLPTSVLSPEPGPASAAQTILFQSRPMAVRSPLGGPMGPRSRTGSPGRHERNSPSPSAKRTVSSSSTRRPPVLQL